MNVENIIYDIKKIIKKGITKKTFTKKDQISNYLLFKVLNLNYLGDLLVNDHDHEKLLSKKQVGTFYKDHKTSFIDYSKFTTKNKRGAYTVKVWTITNIIPV
jgi:hypothetical protein